MDERLISCFLNAGSPRILDLTDVASLRSLFCEELMHNSENVQLHPLGFFYLRKEIDECSTLRFHVWPSDSKIPDSQKNGDLHDHIFELNSIILFGQIAQETFSFEHSEHGEYSVANIEYANSQ